MSQKANYNPLQLSAGVYPARIASSLDENQILLLSFILCAPEHHGKWYFVPFFEATNIPPVLSFIADIALPVSV